jgi:hypothetical protein
MPIMAETDLTATLKEMLDRAGFEGACTADPIGTRSCDDARLLLAAIEAVLVLHQPVTTNGGWLEGREWQECGECGPNNGQENVYAAPGKGEEFWPCPTVRAITAELTGTPQLSEDEGHG